METKDKETKPVGQKDMFLDIKGTVTGAELNKKRVLSLLLAVALFFLAQLVPLDQYGEKASLALGLIVACISMWVTNCVHVLIPGLLLNFGSVLLGIVDYSVIANSLGNSPLFAMTGMMIVSLGAEKTNFGRRVAYFMLAKLGKKPTLIVLAMMIATAILSAFISNLATTVMMAGVAVGILNAMDERPGESAFGKILMICIPLGAMIGGMALINGSPACNATGISVLESATQGAHTIDYATWAKIGIPAALLCLIPGWLFYVKWFKFKNSDVKTVEQSYYVEKLHSLGKMGGSEYRWIITVIAMVICLLTGMKLPMAGLVFGIITICPLVGTVKPAAAFKDVPFAVLLNTALVPLFGTLFTTTGLSAAIGSVITPIIGNMSPVIIMIILAALMGIFNNIFINAIPGMLAIFVGGTAAVVTSMGFNPTIVLLPTIFLASFTLCSSAQTNMLLTFGYNYWKPNDPFVPGMIFSLMAAVITSVVCALLGPLMGISLYL